MNRNEIVKNIQDIIIAGHLLNRELLTKDASLERTLMQCYQHWYFRKIGLDVVSFNILSLSAFVPAGHSDEL